MELESNQIAYLLYLNRADEKARSVTNMAKEFEVAKSTMSRHLAVLKQMDIIKDEGKLTLTDHGRELAKRYEEEIVLLQKWFGQYLPECSE